MNTICEDRERERERQKQRVREIGIKREGDRKKENTINIYNKMNA